MSEEAVSEPGEIRLLPNHCPDVRAWLRTSLGVVVRLAIKFVSLHGYWGSHRELIKTRNEGTTTGIALASFCYHFPRSCDSTVTLE